ncbi:hypothetical protein IW261DRAFT_1594701, partial [Armillaria novae-zelandiae]
MVGFSALRLSDSSLPDIHACDIGDITRMDVTSGRLMRRTRHIHSNSYENHLINHSFSFIRGFSSKPWRNEHETRLSLQFQLSGTISYPGCRIRTISAPRGPRVQVVSRIPDIPLRDVPFPLVTVLYSLSAQISGLSPVDCATGLSVYISQAKAYNAFDVLLEYQTPRKGLTMQMNNDDHGDQAAKAHVLLDLIKHMLTSSATTAKFSSWHYPFHDRSQRQGGSADNISSLHVQGHLDNLGQIDFLAFAPLVHNSAALGTCAVARGPPLENLSLPSANFKHDAPIERSHGSQPLRICQISWEFYKFSDENAADAFLNGPLWAVQRRTALAEDLGKTVLDLKVSEVSFDL